MFGGLRGITTPVGVGNTYSNETWTWDGYDWTLLAPATSPAARRGHCMAYDPIRDKTILYGGINAVTGFVETWEWNGTTWTQLSPANSPTFSNTLRADMCWDSTRGVILMYHAFFEEMWEWDGTDWTQLFPATMPAGPTNSFFMSICDDPVRGVVVGEVAVGGSPEQAETWEWNGTNWTQASLCANITIFNDEFSQWMDSMPTVFDTTLERVVKIVSNDINLVGQIETITWLYPGTCGTVQVMRWW